MQAMRAPGGIGAFPLVGSLLFFGRREPALAQLAQPRIGHSSIALMSVPMDGHRRINRDRYLTTQAVEREALDQFLRQIRFALDQQFPVARRPNEKIEQRLALRAQEPCIDRKRLVKIVGDEALEKAFDIFLFAFGRQAHDCAVEQAGRGWGMRHG